MEFRLSNIAPTSLVIICILTIISYTKLDLQVPTYLYWFISFNILLFFIILPYFSVKKKPLILLKILLLYYFYSIIRGFFIAESYWDYKGLISNSFALLLPVIAQTAINKKILRDIYAYYLKYGLFLIFIIFPFIRTDSYGFYLAPLSPLILFIPILARPWLFVMFSLALFTVFIDLTARSNIIKFVVPIVLLSFYYIPIFRNKGFMGIIRNVFFIFPFLFLFLALSDTFNIFKLEDYIDYNITTISTNIGEKPVKEDLRADTRTSLYIEVLQTAKKHNSWLIGRSPARGNETVLFGEEMKKITGRAERLGNEVAILNIFTWTGLVGVILYMLVFYQASFLAVNRSNNIFSQILGVYIAFRWFYAWVEDANYFTSNTFTLWLVIGLCYSDEFRKMSNLEVKLWVRGISFKQSGNKLIIFPKKILP